MSRTFVLQDWVTIRGNLGTMPLVQDEGRWLDLAGFSDATCWVDVSEVTPPGGTTSNYVTLSLETAAVCDDAYFTPAASTNFGASQTYLNVASTTPVVLRSGSSQATSNLMRYLRWKITPNLAGLWDLTFRIRAVATRNQTFAPTQLSGCVLWLRGDLGVTLNAANSNAVSAWADQSGSGNSASQGTAANQPTLVANAINGLPAISGNGSSQYLVTSAFTAQSTGTLFAVVQSAVGTQLAYIRILEQQFNTTYYLGVNSTGTKYKLIVNNGVSPYGTAEAGTVTAGVAAIVSGIYASNGTIYVNGATPTTSAFTAPTPASQPMFIMNGYSGPGYWNGYLAEAIVYNRALSTTELTRVHRYLGARYNIAVP